MALIKRICVYCGAAGNVDESYRAAAIRMGSLLAENGIGLVYGGGRVGLMGLMADAALAYSGEVTGIILEHRLLALVHVADHDEPGQAGMADAFAILPGGFGTLEEALECITWRQLGLHDKPIFLIDVQEYWVPLLHLFEHVVDSGFAPRSARDLYQVLPRVEDLLDAVLKAPQPHVTAKSDLV